MTKQAELDRADSLYLRGLRIKDKRSVGLWMPIMWHLALRGHTGAMIELASWFGEDNSLRAYGSAADPFSASGLYRRAYRKGDARAAQHMAMGCFNRNDLRGYRHWLRLAAKKGEQDAAEQLRHFETRLWHGAAHQIGRGRPEQKRDGFA